MSDFAIETAINNASASVKIEGYSIYEQTKNWCRKLLRKDITMDEYISLVKQKSGVGAYFHLDDGKTHTALPFCFFHKTNIWDWGDGLNHKWTDDYSLVQSGLFFE